MATIELMTVAEVAKRLKVAVSTIYDAIKDGRLKAYRLGRGGALRISEDNLREFLVSSEVDGLSEDEPW